MQLTLLGIAAVLLIIWLVLRLRRDAAGGETTADARPKEDTTYHAVSIKFAQGACAAARDLSGRRFLATAAPRLPLAECDAASCECRFAHHKDRRTGKDRRSPFASGGMAGASGRYEKERRARSDRRHDAKSDVF